MRDLVTPKRVDARVTRLATRQHGVFSLAQVIKVGGDRALVHRRVAVGRWVSMWRGTYALAGQPLSYQARVMAACLAAGESAFASHQTAAALWLGTREPPQVHLWTPGRIRAPGITAHEGTIERVDVTRLGPIPVTRPERTIIDLASVWSSEQLEGTLDEFLRRDLATLDRLEKRLDTIARSGRAGVRALRRLIDERCGARVSESELETRLLRALREEGFPPPESQYEIHSNGRLIARVDFAYPEVQLVIEAYGKQHHSTWADHEHDLARQNEITALGWRVIVVTWHRLHQQRRDLMETIARALATSRARAEQPSAFR